jgi:hypothetical protein
VVLADEGFEETDSRTGFKGGFLLGLMFDGGAGLNSMCMFLGECRLMEKDVWDLAVQFREKGGKFQWPGYWSVLQCPFCANLATPGDESFIMIVQQFIQEPDGTGTMGARDMPRLCCKECFFRNLQNPSGYELAEYPAMLRQSIPALHYGADHPRVMEPFPSTYRLNSLYEDSGIHGAVSKAFAEGMKQALPGTDDTKARISKSMTEANRGQFVVQLKSVDRQACAACGVSSVKLLNCGRCQNENYCGVDCQKRAWKTHKKVCGKKKVSESSSNSQPSPGLVQRDSNDAGDETGPCPKCKINPVDEGCPAMCASCGTFIVCGPCSVTPAFGGENGRPPCSFFVCELCKPNIKGLRPGQLLRRLLDNRPEGPHVRYSRLMLAQCMLNNYGDVTGITYDVEAAKTEYLWLANNEDYGPAQLAMATFLDPLNRTSGGIWDGPINFPEKGPDSPFLKLDANKAMEYYNRSVENGFSVALVTVGTMYKNGELFPVDKLKAQQMLKQAAMQGSSRAMCNLGQMQLRGDGIPKDIAGGIRLYEQAADLGIFSAMFMIAQYGLQVPLLKKQGRDRVKQLVEVDWAPPMEAHRENWYMVRAAYGV